MAEGDHAAQGATVSLRTSARRRAADVPYHYWVGMAGFAAYMALIFAVDACLPSGFNAAYMYSVAVIGVAMWRKRWVVVSTAAVGIILSGVTYLLKQEAPEDVLHSLVIYNRLGSILVIGLTALIVVVFVNRGERVLALSRELAAAAEAREQSAQLVSAVKRVADIGMWSYDYETPEYVDWSDEVALIHGRPAGTKPAPEESLQHYHPDDRRRVSEAIERAAQSGEPFMEEARVSLPDGTQKVVLVMGKVVTDAAGNRARINGVVEDVTLWRDAESAITAQRRRYSQLVASMPFIIWTANAEGEVDYLNEAMERYTGIASEELVGLGWSERVHSDDVDQMWATWAKALEERSNYDTEFRIKNSQGEYRWHRVSAQPEFAPDGTVLRWWGCAIDIHAVHQLRQRAEEVARERDMVLESITDGVYTLDLEWRFRYLNPAAEVLVNRTAEELIGKVVWDEFPEETQTDLFHVFHKAMRERTVEYITNDSPSLSRQFDVVVSPSNTGLTVFFRDMTEIRRLNEQLAHAQRLESVGRLTGGIAHDFNNLLTVVIGGAEAIHGDPELSDDSREMAELVLEASRRGAELTHRLLAFARRQPLEPKPVDVTNQLMSVLPIIKRTIGEAVSVHTVFQPDLPIVVIDAGQLENALLNLSINARDAMPGGGTITLEAESVVLRETYTTLHGDIRPGTYVVISVTDTGLGIAPDVMPRLFDPFFTTKGLGEGSGLGLPMVWGFAKQSGGHVMVESTVGEGSTFKLYLPVSSVTAAAQDEAPSHPGIAPVSSGVILLVEDDPLVRRFAVEHLTNSGFEVIPAQSGPEALEALSLVKHVDLLFTDVIMPGGMSGRDLADAVIERNPGTPVLYTSGYTENVILHNGRIDEGVALLQKPYSGAQLVERVTEILTMAKEATG